MNILLINVAADADGLRGPDGRIESVQAWRAGDALRTDAVVATGDVDVFVLDEETPVTERRAFDEISPAPSGQTASSTKYSVSQVSIPPGEFEDRYQNL